MPAIEQLARARANYAQTLESLATLQEQRDRAERKLRLIQKKIDTALSEPTRLIDEAEDLQARCLTAWVHNFPDERLYFTRYLLRESGPSDKCWDSRAWLRRVYSDGGRWAKTPTGWHPTLQHATPGNGSGRSEILMSELTDRTDTPGLLEAANKFLESLGWILTDLNNEDQACLSSAPKSSVSSLRMIL